MDDSIDEAWKRIALFCAADSQIRRTVELNAR